MESNLKDTKNCITKSENLTERRRTGRGGAWEEDARKSWDRSFRMRKEAWFGLVFPC